MKKLFLIVAALMLLLGCARAEGGFVSKEQLNEPGRRIGVSQGSAAEAAVMAEIPEADIAYYTDNLLGYTAVAQGKIDAFIYDTVQMQLAIDNGLTGVHLLPEVMDETVKIAVGYSDVSRIPNLKDSLNRFIAEVKADGTLDDMYRRWVLEGNSTMPEIPPAEDAQTHLTVGTTGSVPPYSYYEGGGLTGYDIELAHRFAAWLGAELSFEIYDFDGIIPAAQSGKVDVIMSNLQYLPERSEGLPFSDILYEEKMGILVRGDSNATLSTLLGSTEADTQKSEGESTPAYAAYNGKRIGVATGTTFDDIVRAALPDAEIVYINSSADLIAALEAGKIDGFVVDEPAAKQFCVENPRLAVLDEYLDAFEFGFVLPKTDNGEILLEELDAWLVSMKESGALERVIKKWTYGSENGKTLPDYAAFHAPKGKLTLATEGDYVPMNYYRGNEIVGAEIDLVAQFCETNGYGLEVKVMNFDGILPAVQAGKVDLAAAGISITDERRESVNFSVPYYAGGTVMVVLKDGTMAETQAAPGVRWQDFNGKRLGVLVGPLMEGTAKEFFPDSEYLLFDSYPDCIMALLSGKIDAFLGDEPELKSVHAEQPAIDYIPERLTQNDYCFAFRKNDPESAALCEELNDFLARSREDGTMGELDDIWFGVDEDRKIVDMSDLTGENGTIRVVTTSTDMPFSYIKNGKNVGYDIDLVVRFCRDRGYALELGDVDFAGRIPAIESGKYDFTTDMNATPERREQVLFSDPASYGGIVLAVRSSDMEALDVDSAGAYTSLAQLNGKRVGVQTGTSFDKAVSELLPDAEILYFNSKADLINALLTNKIDAYTVDEPVAKAQMQQNDQLAYIPEYMESFDFAYVFPKTDAGRALCDQLSEYLRNIRADGTMEAIEAKWFGEDDSQKTLADYKSFPAPNGTLNMATEAMYEPFSYILNNEIAGYDIDIVVGFCEAYGYGLEITDMSFDAVLPSVQSGKCDFGGAGITITEERKESVLFSEPNFSGGTVLAVLKGDPSASAGPATPAAAEAEDTSFWGGILSSFNKTFIREGRWKLFVQGVLTTLLITLMTILFGTLLGFGVFMLCRNGNPLANLVTRFCLWLVQGMPMVVLLMILYYIIFGSVAISGIAVAVIGFTLTFGAAVFGLLKMGVGAVDGGQYEAAYALGYSNRRTFFKIILPQALPHVLPAYKGEIVGLIKATAIVGYIAVQDLTKMGDIVRSRTYEAFFPLIAITVIYFILEGLIGFLVSRIGVSFNPKRRRPADILKGVKTDD